MKSVVRVPAGSRVTVSGSYSVATLTDWVGTLWGNVDDWVKPNETARACGTAEGDEKCLQSFNQAVVLVKGCHYHYNYNNCHHNHNHHIFIQQIIRSMM